MKKILFFLFLGTSMLSYSQEKIMYYQEVDTSLVSKHYSKYKIDIPKNWFSYCTDPGMMAHSPIEFKNKLKPTDLFPSIIIHKKSYRKKNIEKSLKSYINMEKQFHNDFKYELFKRSHKLYGKYYVVKQGRYSGKEKEISLTFIFNINRQVYYIFYSADESLYDKYLKEAIDIIQSFKIL